jgi:AhpD family alkylhydroperoxidase
MEDLVKARFDPGKLAPAAYKALLGLEAYVANSSVDATLLHLVKMRASQMNGCGYCIDMHSKDALAAGETAQRLLGLDAWREAPYYTDRERAALEWTEALTFIAESHADDPIYDRVRAVFSEQEVVDLTCAITAINMWNRVAIASRVEPGSYRPRSSH